MILTLLTLSRFVFTAGYEMVVMHLLWTSSVLGFRFPNTEDMDLDSMTNLGKYTQFKLLVWELNSL